MQRLPLVAVNRLQQGKRRLAVGRWRLLRRYQIGRIKQGVYRIYNPLFLEPLEPLMPPLQTSTFPSEPLLNRLNRLNRFLLEFRFSRKSILEP